MASRRVKVVQHAPYERNNFFYIRGAIRAVEAAQRWGSRQNVAAAYGIDRTTLYRWIEEFEQNG